jgi:hypothetical protein
MTSPSSLSVCVSALKLLGNGSVSSHSKECSRNNRRNYERCVLYAIHAVSNDQYVVTA